MSEVLLLNPRGRARRSKARRKNPSAAQLRARAAFGAASRARSRRRNPAVTVAASPYVNPRRKSRRRNPATTLRSYRSAARRHNPIGMGGLSGIMGPLKTAAVMGAGAVGFEIGYVYINRMLPSTLQASPGAVTAGNAIKAVLTVVIGKALSKVTRGMSMQAATGALIVQARDIVAGLLPNTIPLAGLGYSTPGRVVNMSSRVGPNRTTLNAYMRPSVTPMLSAYMQPGVTPLLSGGARQREGYAR